jgi:Asp/Glu/hydantoin racemase
VFCFEEAIKAQPEGYGAVLIDSTTDAGMLAIRSRLDILGLGPGLACWSVASVLGNRFSILAMEDNGVTQSKVAFPSPSQPRDSEIFAPHKEPSTAAR